ncbi:hypothetical protein EV702DRAFT_1049015 [Suillus placidus]|uniref:Uncharacterized protein n=1 Tax=Suillus placidus TaxID=48579 RepID=A0A9P7CYW2_9AGAM|nr:hypothetical protein EV702DRAFT_1049015 [Suillus placidus]
MYLCVKEKQKIVIPPGIQFPDGSSVTRNVRTNKRGGFQENVIILATQQSIPSSVLEGWAKAKGKDKMPSLSSRSAFLSSESESTSDDSDDDSISSESSSSEPPRKSKYRRGFTGSDDEILLASDPENLSESATIVDLTASDNEDTGNFFSSFSLDEHEAVAKPEVPVEADLAPFEQALGSPGPVSTSSLETGEIFATPPFQASGSFAIDPSLDNPWEGNRHFDF